MRYKHMQARYRKKTDITENLIPYESHMKYISFSLIICLSLVSLTLQAQDEEYGLASYYSDGFQGRSTAYGDTYDKDQLTCAHKRYPYGTMLRVTRLDTRRSVNVKVIDKGPFIKGRVVDLSRRAAEVLDIIDMKPVEVKVERLSGGSSAAPEPEVVRAAAEPERVPEAMDQPSTNRITAPAREETAPASEPEEEMTARRPAETTPEPAREERTERREEARTTTSTVAPAKTRFSPVGDDFSPYGLYRITLEKPDQQAGFGVQVASLSNYENVLKQVAELQEKWFENVLVSIEPGESGANRYKVVLGPFEDLKSAQRYQQDLASRYKIRGFVVNLADFSYE